jgi:hypothetical protein
VWDRWQAVRSALAETGDLFASLITAAPYPGALATKHWTIADTAAHVASIAWQYTAMTRDEPLPAALAEAIGPTTVDTVSGYNDVTLRQFTERDPHVLAARLRADIVTILRATEDSDPELPVPWLGESKVPLAGILAHLLNELLVHGREIARAARKAWDIPPRLAGLFFDLFLTGILRYGVGRLLDNDEPPSDRRIAVELRSAHTVPVTIVLHRGVVSVEEPGGPTDVRLSYHPPTLDLVLFHRISQARAVLTGRIVVSGPRPWLLPPFLRTVRLP